MTYILYLRSGIPEPVPTALELPNQVNERFLPGYICIFKITNSTTFFFIFFYNRLHLEY